MIAEKANDDRELDRLIDRMCDQIASVDELAALGHRLANDPAARDYYIACLELHARLAWQMTSNKPFSPEELLRYAGEDEQRGAGGEGRGMAGSPAIDLPDVAAVELPQQLDPEPQTPNPPFPTLSTTNYPPPTAPFVGSWAFSYMVATVIMGVAILGFWAYKITHHQHIAEAPSQSVPSEAMQEMVFVGRITGMVDVKWSDDPRYLPPLSSRAYVPLGRKYILNSGLLEITYDSGAKVILQGPCTYEVESTAGGYLALGKLTAKVESAKPQAANQKSEIRNQKSPSSFILHPSSLFSVRTPTAVVTDLGTEFGVEVSERGLTKTQVFDGSVRLAAIDSGGEAGGGRVLSAGQTGVVQSGNAAIVVADAAGEITFARAMPPPKDVQKALADAYAELVLSLGPVAYYRMERPNDEKELLTVFDSASGGRHGKLSGVGRAGGLERLWCSGRFGGGLELRGEFFGDYVIAPRTPDSDSNQFSFSAWILADSWELWSLIASEGRSRSQFRFNFNLATDGRSKARVAPLNGKDGAYSIARGDKSIPFPLSQWQHVAVVADGSVLHLYRNGVEVDSEPCEGVIAAPPGKYLLLGCNDMAEDPTGLLPASFWDGRIDEVTIFHRALSLEEVKRLYEGPAAEKKGTGPICRNGPEAGTDRAPSTDGRRWSLHKLDLPPFSPPAAASAGKGGDIMNDP